MTTRITLGNISVDVLRKDIKNVHLSVYPPSGRVRISAPLRMNLDTIRLFAISKLRWIRHQQRKIIAQDREPPREFLERESHYVRGRRYLLKVIEKDAPPLVELKHNRLVLQIRPGSHEEKRQQVLDDWYRVQLKAAIVPLIAKWEPLMGVKKWGSCTSSAGSIRLNTGLAKKPAECLEYIVVHEMVHILEPTHNARFIALMDQFMPGWKFYREILNRLPVSHETWAY